MPQAGTIHLFIFIQSVNCFIPGDIQEVFIVRKNVFLAFDGERFSFVHMSSGKIGAKMHKRHTMKHKAALELLFEKNPGTLN